MARRDEAVRKRARRLVEAGGLTRAAIARRCGIHPRTLGKWVAAQGWQDGGTAPDAVERAAPEAGTPAAGGAPAEGDVPAEAGAPEAGLDGASLRRRLRRHVARQIAVLDAQLGQELQLGQYLQVGQNSPSSPRAPDSARVLRDVAGLKRVIDALDIDEGARSTEGAGGAGGPDLADLVALREAIARRYEAFAGDGAAEELPGEPAR